MVNDKNINDISVIIPTLNRCEFLKRALHSVLKQTLKPREIIVVDNGSTDKTFEMISLSFPNVKYLKQTKKGVSASRNKGILNSKSNWLAFLDSDDVWSHNKLEKQMAFNTKNKNRFRLIHTNEIWYRNGKFLNQLKKHKKSGGDIFKNSLILCCISPSSALINKEIFNEYGYFDEDLEVCEDYDLWIRITAREEVGYIDEPMLIKHGGHSDQLSKKFWGMDRFRIFSLEKNLKNNWFSIKQKESALEILIKKLEIIVNGANKRGNKEIWEKYNEKLNYWLKF